MNTLKGLLSEIIAKAASSQRDVALLLSGGVDSLSLGFAATELSLNVVAYTFQIEDLESEDSLTARRAADIMGWGFNLIKVPTKNIERDFLELALRWKCKKKTQFECTWPFLYIAPKIEQEIVLSGIAADGHFGLSKKAMIHFKSPKEKFDKFRLDYFSQENPAGQIQQLAVLKSFGLKQCAPYLEKSIYDYFIQYDWDEINKPRQKQKTLDAYPDQFKKIKPRHHANLQLVAGVPAIFERLLGVASINFNNRSRVMDLCRDHSKI